MSEPIRKPNQTPESYSPKVKPEILTMAGNLGAARRFLPTDGQVPLPRVQGADCRN